ncbi:hypothetical protein [Streptomyces sp. NPDC001530]|uniref:hypothetical protein n=1 Tax=Streptomyces sp. NPDC001530 TaxID=3364582 RepID=UPI0036CEBE89
MSVPYLIDESARSQDADIWFALPAGFVAFPLVELAEAASGPEEANPGHVVRPLWEALPDPESRERFLTDFAPVQRMAQAFLESGAIHCSLGLHMDDEGDGSLLLSLFTLAWRATSWAPRSVIAARAAAGSETNAEHIEALDLPCGPASLVQERLTTPPEAGLGQRDLLQFTAYVPCPDGARIAILTLATTAVGRARHYRALLRDIAESVSFDNPFPDVPDEK